jgi:hypothetical protein
MANESKPSYAQLINRKYAAVVSNIIPRQSSQISLTSGELLVSARGCLALDSRIGGKFTTKLVILPKFAKLAGEDSVVIEGDKFTIGQALTFSSKPLAVHYVLDPLPLKRLSLKLPPFCRQDAIEMGVAILSR